MAETLRVGIIGTGRAGQCHAAAFSRLPGVAVTALWNRTRSRAEKLATTLNQPCVQVYEDWHNLIEQSQVDIVSIATHPTVRQEPFAKALAQQRHVLVEKPLSLSLPEAQAMASLARQAKTVTAISFNWRYSPGCLTTKRAIQDGQIGRLLNLRTEWRIKYDPRSSTTGPWSEMGGSLREAGSHEFDRVRFLTGWQFERIVCSLKLCPERQARSLSANSIPSDIAASVMADMSDQNLAVVGLAITPGEPERRITICGEEGTLIFGNEWVTLQPGEDRSKIVMLGNEVHVFRQRGDDADSVMLEPAESDRQPPTILSGQHTWNRLIADFVTAVRHGDLLHQRVPQLAHISDGLAAQAVINACELSHAERRWVDV